MLFFDCVWVMLVVDIIVSRILVSMSMLVSFDEWKWFIMVWFRRKGKWSGYRNYLVFYYELCLNNVELLYCLLIFNEGWEYLDWL